jgi:hypothetical protein
MTSQASIAQYEKESQELKEQIENRTGKTTEQLYEEREKRVRDAVELRKPDRIPFSLNIDSQMYTGVPNSAAYYDPIAYKRAVRKITTIRTDMCNAGLPIPARYEAMAVRNRYAGRPNPWITNTSLSKRIYEVMIIQVFVRPLRLFYSPLSPQSVWSFESPGQSAAIGLYL